MFNPRIWTRKLHRWGAIAVALPFLLILVTGVLLQVKKEFPWVQPPTMKGSTKVPVASFEMVLQAARAVPEAEVQGWADVDRLDVRPDRGVIKVQAKNRWEVQVDAATAEVLQVEYRRSDVIESLHDGSWFHELVKTWVFLPTALVVLGLWGTGVYLFWLPLAVKWSRPRRPQVTRAEAPPVRV